MPRCRKRSRQRRSCDYETSLNYGFKDITMCDINGIISKDSENLNWMQKEMAKVTNLKMLRELWPTL